MANKIDYVSRVRQTAQAFIDTANAVQALASEAQRLGFMKDPALLTVGCVDGNADVTAEQVLSALMAEIQSLSALTDDQKNAIYGVKL